MTSKTHFCSGHQQYNQLLLRQFVTKVLQNIAKEVGFHLASLVLNQPSQVSIPLFYTEDSYPFPEVFLKEGGWQSS